MTDLPNFEAVKLDEALAKGDELIDEARRLSPMQREEMTAQVMSGDTSLQRVLSAWVEETNASRKAARLAYEAETVELHGVTLVPDETLVTLTINERYGSGPRRQLNCVFVKQTVNSFTGYSTSKPQRERRFLFLKYGGGDGGMRALSYGEETITKVEPVTKVPEWLAGREARRKQQAKS